MKAGLTGAILLVMSGTAMASGNGDGTIHFTGELVDSPCVVATDSQDQNVALGQVKTSVFAAKGDKSPEVSFQIKLEECEVGTLTNATIAFSGIENTDDATLLALDGQAGTAEGVGIGIFDTTNTLIELNTGSSDTPLREGQTVLDFTAAYVQAGSTAVTPGYGDSEVDFNITYN